MDQHQGRCDLHTHSQASDGMQPPADNVKLAKQRGLAAVALTDHDTVAGAAEAKQAGKEYGIDVIAGVEISTRAGGKDIHVLGYYVNTEDELFLQRLRGLREAREERNHLIIGKLQQLGLDISWQEVLDGLGRPLALDESIGRPHMADVLVKKGYATDMRDAFDRYLAEGKPGFVSVPRVTPKDACEWIRAAGGAAVIAHPGLYSDDELVRRIITESLPDGIEVFHSDHGPEEERRYAEMAKAYNLIVTGGSDYHGERQGVVFHGDLGSKTVPFDVLERLQAASHSKR
ncbi:putative metal-dependent phosphoesterase TrpH [Paenibacillus intestini]|uniref:PHP domain-containing protein n=1 Tax=Paenibacillus cucumis (ex Kampfer et al. 2016) TaxID=1776858 RepID=A0ABS7KK46_9BACL|nr:PHP domain-containing protein [Paenibacillus cucumis (ex Kampfer et al. 2016)]MBY0204494.1 PHP domain-containing protein [Paenibacillus cucumis (ex Kampfer et al. 2016)]MDP9699559.1 putative metal-dependent phosphoesterase TrpH [Paenibacillus intestini]